MARKFMVKLKPFFRTPVGKVVELTEAQEATCGDMIGRRLVEVLSEDQVKANALAEKKAAEEEKKIADAKVADAAKAKATTAGANASKANADVEKAQGEKAKTPEAAKV